MRHVATVAANRDRYHITADTPRGITPEGIAQRVDAARAAVAQRRAREIAEPVRAAEDASASRRPTRRPRSTVDLSGVAGHRRAPTAAR